MRTLPHRRPLTRADVAATPDGDGPRYEFLDGVLWVSPAPRPPHQVVVGELLPMLCSACPPALLVLFAPLDGVLAVDMVLEQDLLVAGRSQFTDRDVPGPPLLAVEVLSPSTRRTDLLLRRDRLQAAGVPSYWLVDPDVPSLTALGLSDGTYREATVVPGGASWTSTAPFPMTVVPTDLLR